MRGVLVQGIGGCVVTHDTTHAIDIVRSAADARIANE